MSTAVPPSKTAPPVQSFLPRNPAKPSPPSLETRSPSNRINERSFLLRIYAESLLLFGTSPAQLCFLSLISEQTEPQVSFPRAPSPVLRLPHATEKGKPQQGLTSPTSTGDELNNAPSPSTPSTGSSRPSSTPLQDTRAQFTPKQGGTPKRTEIVFISPTGEEIKTRRQLDQYLRSHPRGPPSSEFDWGTGDTPRRSARISEMVKTPPEAEKQKGANSSSSQKGAKRNKNTEDDGRKVEGDGSGSQNRTKIKKKNNTEDDGHEAEGEAPKDVDMEEAKGSERNNKPEEPSGEGIKTKENVEENLDELADRAMENVEQSEGKVIELEPGKGNESKENQNGTEISPPASDSAKVVSIQKEDEEATDSKKDEASAEIFSENGSDKDTEVNAAPKDNLKPGKEVNENLVETQVSPPAFDSEKVSLTEKDGVAAAADKDEASAFTKGAEISSENGGKKDEQVLHNHDDGKMQLESSPADR